MGFRRRRRSAVKSRRRRAVLGDYPRLAIEQLETRLVLSSASPGIGININSLTDYSPDLLFANAMMTARAWGSPATPWDEKATSDAQGWPTEDAGVVVTDPTGGDVGGTYALSFNGEAASISGIAPYSVQVVGQTYNSATNTTTADIVVPAGDPQVFLSFTGTQRTANSALDTGITNVVLMRPEVTDGSTPYPFGTLFTTQIEQLVEQFSVVRYMDYENTNNNTQVNWSDRTLPSAATQQQTNGGAWEYAVELANATNTDMWINIPEGATSQYVTDLADLIKYGSDGVNPYTSPQANPVYPPLNPNLHVYFEYSNEVWNFGFGQATANENAAVAEAEAGDSPINYDGTTDPFTLAIRRVVEQTVDDSNIFRSVFGNSAMGTQIRPVFEFQYNNLNNTAEIGLDFLNNYYNNADGTQHVSNPEPPDYYLWGTGGAWYYTVNNPGASTIAAMYSSGVQSIASLVSTEVQWATAYGLQMVSYEGGFEIGGDSPTSLQLQANFNSSAEAAEASGINAFFAAGGTLAVFYDSTNSSYALTNNVNNLATPKLLAIQAATAAGLPSATIPTTLSTTVGQSVTISEGTTDDWTTGTTTNAIIFLVQTTAPGAFSIVVQGSQASAANTEYFMVDGQVVPTTVTLVTGGTSVSANSTPAVTLVISTPGLHAISLLSNGASSVALNGNAVITTLTPPPLAASTVSLAANANPAVVGQSVTFTATVGALNSTTSTPTGTVTFYDGANALGTGTLGVVNGVDQATFVTNNLAVGSHSITAAYSGDGTFVTSNSTALTQVIGPAATTTSVTSSLTPATYGQSVTFTATVGVVSPGAGTPTGSVTFYDGATSLGTAALSVVNGSVQATLTTSTLAVGSHSITAEYGGDSNFTTSTSAAVTQTIGQSATTTSVAASLNQADDGQTICFTATVAAVSPGEGTPTGNVTFYDGANDLGSATLSVVDGLVQATYMTSSLAIGSDSITAVYNGDSSFAASVASSANPTLGLAASTTSVVTSASTAVFGQTLTFTATVGAVDSDLGVPTGNVSFFDGATLLGSGTLGLVNGVDQASFSTTASLSVGSHSITAVYDGDSTFAGGTSPVLTQPISKAGTTASVTSSVDSTTFGQAIIFTATVAVVSPGAGTPTGTVTFMDGTTTLGTGTLSLVNGALQATYSTSSLAAGNLSITAVYDGDGCFCTSTSTALAQSVAQSSTTSSVDSSAASVAYGQTVTFTAAIAAVSPGTGMPTGTVTFMDGTQSLGTGTLSVVNGVDQATLATSSLAVGSHSITAVYGGDANFTASTSTAITQAVSQSATTISIGSSAVPAVFGQSVTLTATIAAVSPGAGTPTGSVTFYDGTDSLGIGTLSVVNGVDQATLATSSLAIGSHSITAVFGGDSNFTTSTSTILSQTIAQAATSTSVNSSVVSAVFGQSLTLTANVAAASPGAGTPTGSITFYDGDSSLGTGTLSVVNGVDQVTLATSSLAVGSHPITTVYSGDWNFKASTSTVFAQLVDTAATTTAVVSTANSAVFGQSITFTATIGIVSPGAGTPTGTVTFKDGTITLGTGTLSTVNGALQATYSTSSLTAGSQSITAVYSGDGSFSTSTSAATMETIAQAVSTTTLASSLSSTVFGQSTTFTATLAAVGPGAGTPTGTVTFKDGTIVLGTGTLAMVNGADQATLSTGSLAVGSQSITAVYGGDGNFSTSTSTAITQSIAQAGTTTTVASSVAPATFGQSIVFTATIGALSPGAGTPTGTVTFYDGINALGTGTLAVVNGTDQATFSTSSLAVGSHSISAVYAGNNNFITSNSTTLAQTIGQATPTVAVLDNGGIYTGAAFPATDTVAGAQQIAGASLEGVTPTLSYYVGASPTGTPSSAAPTTAGTYTVVASFAGSTDYTSASAKATFTISQAAPILSVSDSSGPYTGAGFTATDTVNGGSSLEGVTPTLSYYVGTSPTGTPSSAAPTAVGTYTVVANFAGSTDYTSANASATFTISSGLLAYEGFSGAAGPLLAVTDGTGWNTSTTAGAVGWSVQNNSTTLPGYQVNSTGMTYPNLQTSGGSASGGSAYLTAGRRLDTTTTFAPYDVPGTQQIGAAGTTLYFSVLVDRQTAVGGGQPATSIDFTNSNVEWNDGTRLFGVGYYGSSSDSGGSGYWSLLVGSTIVRSTVPIVVGQTALLVLGMTFTATGDTFSLYVNPTSLGGSAPATPSAQLTGSNISFSSIIDNAGNVSGVSTIDELRVGQTFASVTPTAPLAAPAVTTNPTSQSISAGSPVTFTAAASGNPTPTVQWQVSTNGGTTFTNITGATSTTYSFTTTAGQNGYEYQAVFTNSQGTITTTPATLTVTAAPVVTTNPTGQSISAGLPVTFTAAASGNPTPTVQWQMSTNGGTTFTNITGATSTTYSFTTTAGQNGYEYQAVFTNSQGTITTAAATLTVLAAPAVTTSPTSQSISAGLPVTFTAAAGGNPTPTVQWQASTNDGTTFTNIAGATSTTYSFTTTAAQTGYEYQAVFTNSQGTATTTVATLTVLTAPVVTTSLTSQSIVAGNPVTFTAAASGNPTPTVQWQVSTNGGTTFTNITGATSTAYSFTTTAAQNGYEYQAVFTNSQGTATTTVATLTVLAAPVVTTSPTSQSISAGLPVTFTAAASGNPTPTVQWQASTDGGTTFTNISGATSTTYSFATTPAQNGYEYQAIFTNSRGATTTTAATLTVTPALTAPVVTTSPTSQSISDGNAVTFTAAASGNPTPTVQWQVSTDSGTTFTNITGATSTTYSFTTTAAQNGYEYQAVFTNSQGTATTTATLTVIAPPAAPAVTTNPTSQSFSAGSTATFIAAASGNPTPTVQWQVSTDSGTTFTNITGATSTTYSFTATAVQNGYEYQALFSNSQGAITTTTATLTVTAAPVVTTSPTTQTIVAGNPVTFTAAASGNPTPTVQWQMSINGGTTFTNITGATSATYSFITTAAQNGYEYQAVFSNSQGTATTTAAALTVLAAPVVTTNPTSQSISAGLPVTFTAAASGNPTPTVQWQVSTDGGTTFTSITGATSTIYSFTTTTAQTGYVYQALFSNSQGTATTTAATLTVTPALTPPAVSINPTSQSISAGSTVSFTAADAGNPPPTVQWQVSSNGGTTFTNIAGATSTTYSFTTTAAQNGYEYQAVFTNSQGTATTTAATLTVLAAPVVSTNPTSQSISAGNSVTFAVAASGNPTPTVQWQVSTNGGTTFTNIAGATSTTCSFTTTAAQTGYEYQAVFSNSQGAITTTPATLTVTAAPVVTTSPTTQTIVAGNPVTFTAAASGNPTSTVQWQVSTNGGTTFTNIAGATSTTYSFTTTAAQNGYKYQAVFSNSQGTATTTAAALTVLTAPVVTTNPASQSVSTGSTVTFTAAASGNPTPTVQWQVSTNGGTTFTNIAGATSTTYSFTATAAQTGYVYQALFSNSQGTATTTAATLTISQTPSTLLAFDGFSSAAGPLLAVTDGTGWNTSTTAGAVGWTVQNNNTTVPGYQVNSTSLTYPNLLTAGGSASGGSAYLTAGRRLDTTTTFAPYDVPGTQQIGAAGTTLYFSVLVDRQTAVGGGQPATSIDFTNSNVEWNDGTRLFGVGYYGSSSDSGGSGYWSLLVGSTIVRSTVPIVVGQTALLVLGMTFTATGDTFSLYVNPTSLGGSAPATPSAQLTGSNISFSSVVYNAGNVAGVSTIGDLRLGTTFAVVAPSAAPAAPTVTTNPTSQSISAGSPVTFTAAASGNPTPTVQWQVSANGGTTFTNIAGATSTTYSFATTAAQNGYEYQAVFTNSQGTITTTPATLTVTAAPVVTTNPTGQSISAGLPVTFTAAASGNPTPTVQWQMSTNGGTTFTNITGATSTTYSFTTTAGQNGYEYQAVFTNSQSTAISTAATLTVLAPPAVTSNPTSQSISAGLPVTFTAAASGYPTPTVQWQVSTNDGTTFTNIAGATSTTYSFATTAAQTGYLYQAVFTNSQGTITTTPATLTVTPALTAPLVATSPTSQSIVAGNPVTFTAAASGNPTPTVQWQVSTNGGTTFTNITGATSTAYSFTTTAAQNGYEYQAVFTNSQGTATTTAAALTVIAPPAAPVVTTNPTSQSVSAGLPVTFAAAASGNPTPTVQWQVSTNGGTTFTNIAGATSTTYSFTTTAAQTGYLYQAVFTNSQGTITTTPATLTVTPALTAPLVTTSPTSQSIVAGNPVTFTAAASGNPTPTVQWQVSTNGGTTFTNITGATSTTYSFATTVAQTGYQYQAVFTNSQGTATTAPATLTVLAAPVVTTSPTNQSVSAGNTVTFTAAASGNPTPTVQWQVSTNGGTTFTNIAGATSTTYSFTTTATQNGYEYQAVFSNSQGTATTTAASLIISQTPSTLLAFDGFSSAAAPLLAVTDGTGWNTSTVAGAVGWTVQNNSTAVPGYQVNATGLTYPSLQTSGGSASGGSAYLTAGRRLDTTTTFAPYDVAGTKQIGAAGTTLYFSVLVDRQTAVGGGQPATSIDFTNSNVEWNDGTRLFGVGYYGSSSDSGGSGYWSLLVGSTIVRSTVPIVVGQTALLVLGMTFTSTGDTFSLYVNPTSLGGSAPAAPSAQLTGSNVTFSSVIYNAGNVAGVSTIADLSVGTTFAAVTPLASLPPQDPAGGPNTAASAANVPALTMSQLTPIVNEAIAQWSAAGITPAQTQLLESANFVIQNLSSQGALAVTGGTTIYIDPTAEGYGWFEDGTPVDPAAFGRRITASEVQATAGSPAFGHMDLLTVVMHEMGHVLGLPDYAPGLLPDDLMTTDLPTGIRRYPTVGDVDAVLTGQLDLPLELGSPAPLGPSLASPAPAEPTDIATSQIIVGSSPAVGTSTPSILGQLPDWLPSGIRWAPSGSAAVTGLSQAGIKSARDAVYDAFFAQLGDRRNRPRQVTIDVSQQPPMNPA